MSRLRIVFIVTLAILVVLVVFTVFRPMVSGREYSVVSRESLVQGDDQWIIQFAIINHEGIDQNYTITVVIDGKPYYEDVLIQDGRMFVYIHHIRRDRITEGIVSFSIRKKGEETPFEQTTYYLK